MNPEQSHDPEITNPSPVSPQNNATMPETNAPSHLSKSLPFKNPFIIGIIIVIILLAVGGGAVLNTKLHKTITSIPTPTKTITQTVTITPAIATSTPTLAYVAPLKTATPTINPTISTIISVVVVPSNTPIPTSSQMMTISLTGTIYSDDNCNNIKDPGEAVLPGVIANVYQNPQFALLSSPTTDGNGTFRYSTDIPANGSIDLQVTPVSPTGYKSSPKSGAYAIQLSASQQSTTFMIPEIPDADVGKCQ